MDNRIEHYIVAEQSPLFCQYVQEWQDPEEISPVQIPNSTTVQDAMKWWLLATICEKTTDEIPYVSQSEIRQSLQDQKKENGIEDYPLGQEILGREDARSLHPASHKGKNAFYIIGYCYAGCDEVHSYIVDPAYRRAFLAAEEETGIDARTILECIGREWHHHREDQHTQHGVMMEALSALLSFLNGNDLIVIKPESLEKQTLDLLLREELLTRLSSGDYILPKGVGIDTIQGRLENHRRECSREDEQWWQNSLLLKPTPKEPIKIVEKSKEANKKKKQVSEEGNGGSTSSSGDTPDELLTAFSITPPERPLDEEYLQRLESRLREIFSEFGIDCTIDQKNFDITGPRVIRANIKLGRGVVIDQVQRRSRDIANKLYSDPVLFDFDTDEDRAPTDVSIENVAAKGMIGIPIPRKDFSQVGIRGLLETLPGKSELEFPIGVNITGNAEYSDLISMPHLLIAGHPGSGKSVFLNTFIISLIYQHTPDDLKLQLIDPKGGLEFGAYEGLPYLCGEIVDSAEKSVGVLQAIISEMENRYHLFKQYNVKKLSEYNELDDVEKKPYIVVVIDEFSDLVGMARGKDVKSAVVRIAQKGRAAGIHMVIATQYPTVKVIDGMIKANLPARLSFRVATQTASRVILDENGAENLYGKGDCLLKEPEVPELRRFQTAYVSNEEIETFVQMVMKKYQEA